MPSFSVDLVWYLADPEWPEPKCSTMRWNSPAGEASRSPRKTGEKPLWDRVGAVAWDRVILDVQPFLEPGVDTACLTRESVMALLG